MDKTRSNLGFDLSTTSAYIHGGRSTFPVLEEYPAGEGFSVQQMGEKERGITGETAQCR